MEESTLSHTLDFLILTSFKHFIAPAQNYQAPAYQEPAYQKPAYQKPANYQAPAQNYNNGY